MLASANVDTLQGVSIVQIAGNLAFACTVMIGFVSALPYELRRPPLWRARAYPHLFR